MFSTIVVVIVVLYILGYIGMITFDLFIKKDPTDLIPKPQDVEIDITDEAGQFKPILVEKDDKTGPQTSLDEKAQTEDTDQQTQDAATVSTTSTVSEQKPEQEKVDEPKRTDEETKRRISELVKLRRQEILAEEMGDQRVSAPVSQESNPKDQDNTVLHGVEEPSTDQASVVPKDESPKSPIGYYKPKAPTQPEHAPLKFFEFKVRIETTTQLTKPQGGLTAEQLSTEAKKLTTDEKMKLLKEINNYWELKENSRTLDEDERIAIEKAREARHEAHPTFSA
ncbi:hypothetical protein PRBRB14_21460 [Hallella multisaccharivorax DSM 17128]|uniref:Uncharacterized protein n=1 Tax=Hallella multisaccharivorax DSM 17128 TaxID=688246 RepID=F8N7M7_9BACT|nr:hypothetical protein [Hallella multisaccharivorax]EGN57487.1 hypothetical protein Premu_2093 [Hallella multisaccharivorax DSM 17128]GJG31267.1 hypothetical protein PRBRB14_21460 [Hallella multisaccharivorax DSM 17128]